jgi:hypothetical protein
VGEGGGGEEDRETKGREKKKKKFRERKESVTRVLNKLKFEQNGKNCPSFFLVMERSGFPLSSTSGLRSFL